MEQLFGDNYYFTGLAVIFGLIIATYIGISILWNRKWVPARRAKGQPTAYFGNTFNRITKFAFKEDPRTIAPKKLNNKILNKLLTIKTINITLLLTTIALIAAKIPEAYIPALLLITTIWIQTSKPLTQRDRILQRMFAVASSGFRYGRGSELNPWGYVKIKKWEDLNTPGETHITIPANWDSSSIAARDGFEAHFNTTVTDNNSWIYEWKSADGLVIAKPINHLPEMAAYPGSEKHPWHSIPLGLGTQGEVSVDLTATPHMLVCGSTGSGKMVSLKTPVQTANKGWVTIGDIEVGDTLIDPNGKLTKVTHLHPIFTPRTAFEVEFRNGEKLIVDGEHLWETETRSARISRFNNTRKEASRKRTRFLTKGAEIIVRQQLENMTSEDTISIKEVAAMINKTDTTKVLHDIAKQVGPAEQVIPRVVFSYSDQVVKQKQNVHYVNSAEFINLYNNRRSTYATVTKPLTRSQYDKLGLLVHEVRETDSLTADSIIEYLRADSKITRKFIEKNFDSSLNAVKAVETLIERSTGSFGVLPDKIFSIDNKEHINVRDLALLLNAEVSDVKSTFHKLKGKIKDTFVSYEEVELYVKAKEVERDYIPYFTYPAKMYLTRLLDYNNKLSYDQTNKRELSSVKTTLEIMETLWTNDKKTHRNHTIVKTKPVEFEEKELPIHPYVFGAWLGDGYSHSGNICGEDHEIFDYIEALGYEPTETSRNKEVYNIAARNHNELYRSVKFPSLHVALKTEGLLAASHHSIKRDGEVKFIPQDYLLGSIDQRRELLRGLLDTDGSVGNGGAIEFYTSNPRLRDDVKRLVASLGYIPFVREREVPGASKTAFTVSFQADPVDRVFMLARKNVVHAERFTGSEYRNSYADAHQIVGVREVEPVPMRCLSVDSESRLFLVGDSLVPTHNSVLQRNLVFHCIQHNDMWRFLGVDVKRVELTPFKRYSKTVLGIGANLEDGVEIVRYAKEVMETRYEEMEAASIREGKTVNHFSKLLDAEGKPPYAIMLMVDEAFMFLSLEGAKTDEGKMRDQLHGDASVMLGEIARLGRAAGVHLVLATQRPDAAVIKGELKANLDIRIAAGRLDATPSSMVLDSGAATQLPGHIKGRGIVRFGGHQEQFQGYFAEGEWIEEWLKKHPGVEPDLYPAGGGSVVEDSSLDDELADLASGYDFEDGAVEVDGTVVVDDVSDAELARQEAILESPLGAPGVIPVEYRLPSAAESFMDKISADDAPVTDMLSALQENEDFSTPAPVIEGIPEVNEDMSEEEAQEYLRSLYGMSLDDDSSGGSSLLGDMFKEPVKSAPSGSPSVSSAPPVDPVEEVKPVVEDSGVGFPTLGGKKSSAPSFPSLPGKGSSGGGFPQLPKLPPRG